MLKKQDNFTEKKTNTSDVLLQYVNINIVYVHKRIYRYVQAKLRYFVVYSVLRIYFREKCYTYSYWLFYMYVYCVHMYRFSQHKRNSCIYQYTWVECVCICYIPICILNSAYGSPNRSVVVYKAMKPRVLLNWTFMRFYNFSITRLKIGYFSFMRQYY